MIIASFLPSWIVYIIILFPIAETEAGQTSARPPHSVNQFNTLEAYILHQRHVSDLNHTGPTTTFRPSSTLDVDVDTPATITKVSFVTHTASDWDNESDIDVIVSGVVATVAIIGLFIVIGLCVRRRKKAKISFRDTERPTPITNPIPQNIGLHAQGDKIITSHHTEMPSPNSTPGADVIPMFRSPLPSTNQGTDISVYYPPVYETLGNVAQVHEMGGPSIRRSE